MPAAPACRQRTVLAGVTPQGEDGRLAGEGAGRAQGVEADGRGDGAIGGVREIGSGAAGNENGFAEDGAEENQVDAVAGGCLDLLGGMAGDAEEWRSAGEGGRCGEELADLGDGEAVAGGEVKAVDQVLARRGLEGEEGRHVEQQFGGGGVGAEDGTDVAGKAEEFGGGEILFAELDEVDAEGGPAGDAGEQDGAANRLLRAELGPIGDGIPQHVANRSKGVAPRLNVVLSRQYTSPQ